MKLTVVRTQFGTDATNGMLFIDGIFECYTLEDQYQAVKVMHETCIPEGTYDIKFRTVGGFHEKYKKRYGNDHYGMLHLQDVPNFTYILIHAGNTDEHTSGCGGVFLLLRFMWLSEWHVMGNSRELSLALPKTTRQRPASLLRSIPVCERSF